MRLPGYQRAFEPVKDVADRSGEVWTAAEAQGSRQVAASKRSA
jgi:hypothetical protein